jgi:MYXO-CTERM domain-containing protein
MRNARWATVGLLGLALTAPAALAQDISSPDALWRATLDTNGTGQITNLYTPSSSTTDNLFETLWYEATDGGLSTRIEGNYTNTGSVVGANSASFSLVRNDGVFGLDVAVNMANGAGGGAQFALTWTNLSSSTRVHKAFAYADLDIAGSAGGDDSAWTGSAIYQSEAGSGIYFGNLQAYKSWEITTFASLRTALDGGIAQLANAGGGVSADFTGAISGFETTLAPGDSYTFRFSLNSDGTPAPGALALMGIAGLVGTRRRRR